MKILLDAIHFAYRRMGSVLVDGNLYPQDQGRLTEAYDQLAHAVAFVLGDEDAQKFLETPDNYRVIRADDAHVSPSAELTPLADSEEGKRPG